MKIETVEIVHEIETIIILFEYLGSIVLCYCNTFASGLFCGLYFVLFVSSLTLVLFGALLCSSY